MSALAAPLATAAGPVRLRPETAGDAAFLEALFRAHAAAVLAPAGLDEAMLAPLLAMQHRSQTASYAAAYPHARRWIAELDGSPVGRLMEVDEAGALYVVDIAVAPACLKQGIGGAMLAALLAQARASGRGVRALVAPDNAASLAMFGKLGFVQSDPGEGGPAEGGRLTLAAAAQA